MYRFRTLTAVIAAVGLAACGTDGITGETEAQVQGALVEDFGGLTTADEDPYFGDEEAFDEVGEAAEDPEATYANDPVADDADMEVSEAEAEARDESRDSATTGVVFAIRATWGRQRLDRDATEPTRWNPTISTDCGALRVRRLVKMEEGEGVVRPRDAAQSVAFTSATLPHYDGAVLALGVRSANRGCMSTGGLTFSSDALDAPIEIPFSDLTDRVEHIELGDGNSVLLLAHRVEPVRNDECARGHLGGRWIRISRDESPASGVMRGRVVGEFGELLGHVKGVYGVPNRGRFEGQQVFFGKYIRRDGTFAGLYAGRYGNGQFMGGWHTSRNFTDLRGLMGGRYREAPAAQRDGGVFRGRWSALGCNYRPTDEEPLATTDER